MRWLASALLFLLPGTAQGFSISATALSQEDVDAWMTGAWEAAKQNASAWHGTEAWMPSAEQTGHAEQDAWHARQPYCPPPCIT